MTGDVTPRWKTPEQPRALRSGLPRVSKKRQALIDAGQFVPKARARIAARSAKRAMALLEHAEVRQAVFARDGFRCRLLGVETAGECFGALTPHHVLKASQGGTYTEGNLVALCERHNGWVEDNPLAAHALGLVRRRGDAA